MSTAIWCPPPCRKSRRFRKSRSAPPPGGGGWSARRRWRQGGWLSDGFARLSPVGVDRAGGHRPPLRMVYRTISVGGGRAGGDTGPYGVRLSDMGRENIGASDMVLENVCRGAHRAPVLPWSAGVDRAGAQCAPLQPVYQHFRKARRHLRHRASDLTFKLRRQVVAREAERQRTPTAWLKTGERSRDTACFARATAAASEAPWLDDAPVYRRCVASWGS